VLVFLMLRLTPGDPAAVIAGRQRHDGPDRAHPIQLGLDQPILAQFVIWSGNLLAAISASRSSSRRPSPN
jgi:peptide/nickel transport system permease protein